jgi:hypothetical protein
VTWYRFHGYAGPGHQSDWEEYVWLEGVHTEEDLEDIAEEMVPRWASFDGSNITKKTEVVEELPEKIREEKIDTFRRRLKSARHMLKVLGAEEESS